MSSFHMMLVVLVLWQLRDLGLASAFDLGQVNLTLPPQTIGVKMAVEVVRQINRSYGLTCFVNTHNVEGVNRRLHAFPGVTGGVTRSFEVPFSPGQANRLTDKSRCAIFIVPLPESEQDLLDYDHALWSVYSPTKVILFLQENGSREHGLAITRFIPAINTTFPHLLLTKATVFNESLNQEQEQMEMYCLSIDPAVRIFSFEECRTISQGLNYITMTVSHITAVPTAIRLPNGKMTGSDVTILNMLRDKYGFQYKLRSEAIVDSPPNSTTGGQLSRVSSGAVDLGIGGAAQTNERLQKVDFLVYLYIQDMTFITPTPWPLSIFYTIVLPFDGLTWGLIGASSLSLVLSLQLSDFVWKRFFYSDAVSKIDTMYHHSVIVFSSLIGYELPHSWLWHRMVHAKSILLAVTFFSGFFLNMDYKSTLRANLYTEMYSPAIDTYEDIYRSGLPVYIQNGSLQTSLMQTTQVPILQKIYSRALEKETFYKSTPKGNPAWLDRMIDRGEAIFIYYTMALSSRNGTYHVSSDVLYKSISSFMVPKCSTLPSTFNIDILWLNAGGIPTRLFKHFLGSKASRRALRRFAIKTSDDPLDIEQVLLIFMVLAGGLMLATLALAYEVYEEGKSKRRANDDSLLGTIDRVFDIRT